MLSVAADNAIQSIRRNDDIAPPDRLSFEKFLKEATDRLKTTLVPNFDAQYRASTHPKQARLSSAALQTGDPTIVLPQTPYTHTMPSQYYRGSINPIARRTVDRHFNFDSRFRNNYFGTTASNFRVTPSTQFNDILDMRLSAVEIPLTFFNISKQLGNNFFCIRVPYVDVDTSENLVDSLIVEIPSGNYNYDGLVEIINIKIHNAGGVFADISFIIDMTDGQNGSGRMIASMSPDNVLAANTFVLDFISNVHGNPDEGTSLPLKMGWMMGFRNGRYENCAKFTYVSEGVVDIVGTKYIFFILDDYAKSANENFVAEFNQSTLSGSILARISLPSAQILDMAPNNTVAPLREYHGPVSINNLHVQIVDDFGRNLDLSNMDISFCLSMTQAYNI